MGKRRTRWRKKRIARFAVRAAFGGAIVSTVLAVAGGGAIYWHFSRDLPDIISPADYRPNTVTRIVAGRDDALVGEFFKERRYVIPYEKLPEQVVKAFISAEDDKFFEHQGFNLAAIIRASIANFRAGHVVQGGSTITQQVAKSLLLTSEKSFVRKFRELILSGRIETNLTKQQILYLYLNQIYLGHGAYGVQAAALTYFNKDVSALTLAEAALLAGLPQAPGKYSPNLNPKRAKERQLYVLRRMYENGFISQAQMTEAGAHALRVYQDQNLNVKYAPYVVEHVRRYLVEKYGEKAVYEDGLTVVLPTTRELALAARRSLAEGLRVVDKRGGYRGPKQRLKGAEEVEKFLSAERVELIDRKVGYRLFLADGRLNVNEAMSAAAIRSDLQLLDEDEVYEAVVTGFDDKAKVARVMIGGARAELPVEKMKWARQVKDGKPGPEPALPSRVLEKGDVIFVRVVQKKEESAVVALEQDPAVQGALFSLDVETGTVLAMEGGFDFGRSEFNRAVQAQRQPGSSFKPLIYAAALEKGYTPTTVIQDSPIVYEDAESGKWKPTNFEEKFYGDTTFRQALIKSRNVPTIKIVQSLQVPHVIEYAKRLGLVAQYNADLSISLGSATTNLVELTRVYALFPRRGRRVDPIFISKVVDRDGKVLEESKPKPLPTSAAATEESPAPLALPSPGASAVPVVFPSYPPAGDPDQVLDPRVAYVMTHLMKEVVAYGTGHEAKSLGRQAAGKTGTTNEYIDAWFMGFTPQVVTGVWVGNDSQKPIGPSETGARAALPIWLSFMREAVKPYPDADFLVPPGVVFASIDPSNGKLAPPNSSQAIKEAFIEGTQPTEFSAPGGEASDSESKFLKEDVE